MKRQPSEWEKIFVNKATDRVNLQSIQAALAAQYKKNQLNQKTGERDLVPSPVVGTLPANAGDTVVQFLIWKDPTCCCRATKPMCHSY